MSRVGKLPVAIPSNIKVTINSDIIEFDTGKAKKEYKLNKAVKASFADGKITLTPKDKSEADSSMFNGMDRSNIKNLIQGLVSPFKKVLEINGVGYKASVDKNVLFLTLGYSHDIVYALPAGITATFEKPNLIVITGSDKVLVGRIAAEIISFRKPEPYKGKGVKEQNKFIVRKEAKKK